MKTCAGTAGEVRDTWEEDRGAEEAAAAAAEEAEYLDLDLWPTIPT